MSNIEAIEELAKAIDHLKKAQDHVETSTAEKELDNTIQYTYDVLDGVLPEITCDNSHSNEGEGKVKSA